MQADKQTNRQIDTQEADSNTSSTYWGQVNIICLHQIEFSTLCTSIYLTFSSCGRWMTFTELVMHAFNDAAIIIHNQRII